MMLFKLLWMENLYWQVLLIAIVIMAQVLAVAVMLAAVVVVEDAATRNKMRFGSKVSEKTKINK